MLVIIALPLLLHAFDPVTFEKQGMIMQMHEYSTNTIRAPAYGSYTVTGILNNWSFETVGATATFQIRYSTGPDSSWQVHTSTVMTAGAGQIFSESIRWMIWNPMFVVRDLGQGGTAYFRIETANFEGDTD